MSPDYDLNDLKDVDHLITDMYDSGCRPILGVRASKVSQYLEKGYKAKPSWIKEAGDIIVGTMGRPPYDTDSERVYFKLNIPRHRIRARYTGPDSKFNGVVYITGTDIRPEELEIIDYENAEEESLVSDTRSKLRLISGK